MKKIITMIITIGFFSLPLIGQGNGNQGRNRPGQNFNGGINRLLTNLPEEDVDLREERELMRMREEEKLARDVYLTLFETWGHNVFRNIARSEERHMEALGALLDKYNLTDPITNESVGMFSDPEFQALYYSLIAEGQVSLQAALQVGAKIEDLDIADLKTALKRTNNRDIQIAFQNLQKGSRNHLRIFSSFLARYQITYQAQYLSPEEVEAILNSPPERGLVNENGEPFYGNTGW